MGCCHQLSQQFICWLRLTRRTITAEENAINGWSSILIKRESSFLTGSGGGKAIKLGGHYAAMHHWQSTMKHKINDAFRRTVMLHKDFSLISVADWLHTRSRTPSDIIQNTLNELLFCSTLAEVHTAHWTWSPTFQSNCGVWGYSKQCDRCQHDNTAFQVIRIEQWQSRGWLPKKPDKIRGEGPGWRKHIVLLHIWSKRFLTRLVLMRAQIIGRIDTLISEIMRVKYAGGRTWQGSYALKPTFYKREYYIKYFC